MSRFVLKYIYLILGTGVALLGDRLTPSEARAKKNHSTARSPMEAAEYHANELVNRPLRTVGLVIIYQLVFAGIPACAAYTEEITSVFGDVPKLIGGLFEDEVIPAIFGSQLSDSTIELLPAVGVVVGLVFTFIIHQSLRTATSIQLQNTGYQS
jgi:hypothetical protein